MHSHWNAIHVVIVTETGFAVPFETVGVSDTAAAVPLLFTVAAFIGVACTGASLTSLSLSVSYQLPLLRNLLQRYSTSITFHSL